ncbi:uncharacterized protein LOC144711445 [Wolffia australiana]
MLRRLAGGPRRLPPLLRRFCAPPTAAPPPAAADFMAQFLIDSCELPLSDAIKACRHLAHLKSPDRPAAVLRLLRREGLSPSHLRRLVVSMPKLLLASPDKTLEPKIRALRSAGFSPAELGELVTANPNALRVRDVIPKIEFWRKLLGSKQKFLKLARNVHLLSRRIDGDGTPILSFLRRIGMPDPHIAMILERRPRLVSSRLKRIELIAEQVQNLGVSPGSRTFVEAFSTVSNLSQATLESKSSLLLGYGWSRDDLLRAFRQFPIVLRLSEGKLRVAMDFLIKEAGYEPSYVARKAVLLGYSIDRRLKPRFYVLRFLKEKGLPGGRLDLLTAMMIAESKFKEKYLPLLQPSFPGMIGMYPDVAAVMNAVS